MRTRGSHAHRGRAAHAARTWAWCVLAAVCIGAAAAARTADHVEIPEMGELRLQQLTSSDDTTCVAAMFYTPHCGHCKKFSTEWARMHALYGDMDNVHIMRMNAHLYNDVAARHHVSGVPAFVVWGRAASFRGQTYDGPHELAALQAWVHKMCFPGEENPLALETAPVAETRYASRKALVQAFFAQVLGRGNFDAMDSMLSPVVEWHDPATAHWFAEEHGVERVESVLTVLRTVLGDGMHAVLNGVWETPDHTVLTDFLFMGRHEEVFPGRYLDGEPTDARVHARGFARWTLNKRGVVRRVEMVWDETVLYARHEDRES